MKGNKEIKTTSHLKSTIIPWTVLSALLLVLGPLIAPGAIIFLDDDLINVSTRLGVLTEDNVAIAGFTINQSQRIVVRALGPTLREKANQPKEQG